LKRQKKNSLRNDTSAKHSIKQQTFTNAYLLICHHKKRRNSTPYLTNIGSFSKAPLDSYPPTCPHWNQIQCQAFPWMHILCSLWNLHRCLEMPNWICHNTKGQATCILFKKTHWSSNEIHCDRTWTACNSGNTLWVQVYSPWTFDYTIYTNHKNHAFSNFTTDHVTCWWLIVEEYGPNIVYLPSKCNIITDALSHLPKLKELHDE
jgi:hypothetical protein